MVAAVLLAVLPACAGARTAPATPAATPRPPVSSGDPRLWIKDGERVTPFENGHTVNAGGNQVEIFLAPYPPARYANVDVYVTRDGVAVEGANVSLQLDMTVMEHGPFDLAASEKGGGHYLAPLEFIMTGDFWLNVAISSRESSAVINMFVRAIRS